MNPSELRCRLRPKAPRRLRPRRHPAAPSSAWTALWMKSCMSLTSGKAPNPISAFPPSPGWPSAWPPPPAAAAISNWFRQLTKLGGNGPIMANALASLGLRVTYLGNLGYPNLHPVFPRFCRPRRSPQHRRTRHHRRPGVRRRKNNDWQTRLAQGRSTGRTSAGPLRTRKIHRQTQRLRPGRLRQLDDAPLHERRLGSHPSRRLPRPGRPGPR